MLLHVADQIRFSGPPRCYWSFWVERACSTVTGVTGKLRNRRSPFRNLALEMERIEKVGFKTTYMNLN